MKKPNSLLLAAVVAITLGITASAAFALQPQGDDSRWIQQRVMQRIVARVEGRMNITPQQREQAKAILKTEQPTIVALAARAQQEHTELASLQSFDEPTVRSLSQKYAATNTDLQVERTKIRLELRALLTDAQRQQLDQMRARAGSHFDERLSGFIDAL